MITAWVESLLPGARNLRAPLLAGLLWALTAWLVFYEQIPLPRDATGWAQQVYALAAGAGPIGTAVVVSAIIWVAGVLSMAVTLPVAAIAGAALISGRRQLTWHAHVRRAKEKLRSQLAELERKLATARDNPGEANVKNTADLERQVQDKTRRLTAVDQATRFGWVIARNQVTIGAIGDPSPDRTRDIAEQIVTGAARAAIDAALEKHPRLPPIAAPRNDLWDLDEAFVGEFDPDPMDALRGLDEKLYLDLDRERSEREVRIAVSPPLLVIGTYGANAWSPWFYVVVVLSAVLFLRNAIAQSAERSRIMRLVDMKRLETPSLRAAAAMGRDEVRRALSEAKQEQQPA